MRRIHVALVAAASLVAFAQPATSQECDLKRPGLTIYGRVASTLHLEPSAIRLYATIDFRASDHQGKETVYRGVPLTTLLSKAGVPSGPDLRGVANQIHLRVEARDGYAAVLALAETDSSFRAEVPLLAFQADGRPLDEATGPFQLIVPGDLRHGRWVRQVACIRVAQ